MTSALIIGYNLISLLLITVIIDLLQLSVSDVMKFWFDVSPFGILPVWAPSCQHWVEVWYLASHETHGQRLYPWQTVETNILEFFFTRYYRDVIDFDITGT